MSRFYASIQGNRGEATRSGASIIRGHIRGWRTGVRVVGDKLAANQDADVFVVYVTGGSTGSRREVCIGSVHETEQGRIFTLDDRIVLDGEGRINLDE